MEANIEKLDNIHPLLKKWFNLSKIKQLYPGLSVNKFWTTANSSVCSLFHLFNKISAQDSSYTTFDKADLDTVLNSGIITFGATPIKTEQANDTDISKAIRNNLKKNILAGADISTGNVAACVMVVNNKLMDEVPQEALEHGFEQRNLYLKQARYCSLHCYRRSRTRKRLV